MFETFQRDILDKVLANIKVSAGRGNVMSYLRSAEYELGQARRAVEALEVLKIK
jgi:hypothetical protein